ncbi:hypothetical protein Tco_1542571, partial [Tanacetum coccineum]
LRIRGGLNEQIDRQMAGALGARNGNGGNRNGGNENGGNGNGGNGNGGNRNSNRNGGGNGYNFRGLMPARECTFKAFLKCHPLSFNGTEGVVRLTRRFEKMETVFHISNCPERTYEVDDISVLSKKQGPEDGDRVVELGWKRNDLTAYTGRFQELGNIIATEPAKLQDAIRVANNLMDQKLKGYARSTANKRRLESNPRDNRGQQLVFKRQNVGGQNVAIAYTTGNNEKKGKYCPKLRNQNRGNKTGNKNGNKTGNQTRGNKATTKAYAIRGGGANPDSNIVTEAVR